MEKRGWSIANQLCGPPEFFQLLSSKPKPMSPTTIPHRRPPSELAGCDTIPAANTIEPANTTMDAAIDFMPPSYPTGGLFSRRDFKRRMDHSKASVAAIPNGAEQANCRAISHPVGAWLSTSQERIS